MVYNISVVKEKDMKNKTLIILSVASVLLSGCTKRKEIRFENNSEYKESVGIIECQRQTNDEYHVSIKYEYDKDMNIVAYTTTTMVNLEDYTEEEKEEYINHFNSMYEDEKLPFASYTSELTENEFKYVISVDAHRFSGEDWRSIGLGEEFFSKEFINALVFKKLQEELGFSCE